MKETESRTCVRKVEERGSTPTSETSDDVSDTTLFLLDLELKRNTQLNLFIRQVPDQMCLMVAEAEMNEIQITLL